MGCSRQVEEDQLARGRSHDRLDLVVVLVGVGVVLKATWTVLVGCFCSRASSNPATSGGLRLRRRIRTTVSPVWEPMVPIPWRLVGWAGVRIIACWPFGLHIAFRVST